MKWKKRFYTLTTMMIAMLFATVIPVGAKPSVQIDPGNFVSEVTNPYFPLEPGTTYTYRGETEGVPTRNVTTVTSETKVILGVTTIVVRDQAYEDGVLVEDTFDWYAQMLMKRWHWESDTKNWMRTATDWHRRVEAGGRQSQVMEANPKKGDNINKSWHRICVGGYGQVTVLKILSVSPMAVLKMSCIKEWTPLERELLKQIL
jgi:hypothetical protein